MSTHPCKLFGCGLFRRAAQKPSFRKRFVREANLTLWEILQPATQIMPASSATIGVLPRSSRGIFRSVKKSESFFSPGAPRGRNLSPGLGKRTTRFPFIESASTTSSKRVFAATNAARSNRRTILASIRPEPPGRTTVPGTGSGRQNPGRRAPSRNVRFLRGDAAGAPLHRAAVARRTAAFGPAIVRLPYRTDAATPPGSAVVPHGRRLFANFITASTCADENARPSTPESRIALLTTARETTPGAERSALLFRTVLPGALK